MAVKQKNKVEVPVNGNGDNSVSGNVFGDFEPIDGVDFVITSRHKKIETVGVSTTTIQQLQSKGELPPPPYREMATALGVDQKEELTEENLLTDEDREKWKEYKEKRDIVLSQRANDFIRYIFFKGTVIDEEEIDLWVREQEVDWGVTVPSNRIDRKVAYIQDELIGGSEDAVNVISAVLAKTGAPQEAIEQMRGMFRSALRRNPTK